MTIDDLLKEVTYGTPTQTDINYVEQFLDIGMCDSSKCGINFANENKKHYISILKNSAIRATFFKAERISKEGNPTESNRILFDIYNNVPHKAINFGSLFFQRLAINFRKLKDYKNEIKYINIFLKDYQPAYGKTMWKPEFTKRLTKAKLLYNKQQVK